jgi:geranylgeranyl transferase type-2 subunit alpha
MHGLLIRDRKELTEEEKAAELASATSATELLHEVIKLKKNKEFTPEAFGKCMELLKLNPELSLAWNFRREIINSNSDGDKPTVIENEIKILNSVMVDLQMTKSYCLWSHRRWLLLELKALDQLDGSVLDGELELVDTILKLDGRNFHSWSYRQWFRQNFTELENRWNDIEFSQKLIDRDFSNYSAWFLRSWAVGKTDAVVDPESELELIWNALFTEPNDQSCWQYHDWLLERYPDLKGQDEEFMKDLEAVVEEKDSKYLLLARIKSGTISADKKEEMVQKLVNIDPMRKGFYLDL